MKRNKVELVSILLCMVLGVYGCDIKNIDQEKSIGEEMKSDTWEWAIEPSKYENLYFSNDGLVIAINEYEKYGVMNLEGEIAVPFSYDYVSQYNYGIACAEKDGETFYIDKAGNRVWDETYEDIRVFQEELGAVKIDDQWGFIALNGDVMVPCQYDDVKSFVGGMAAVKEKGKWGFIDKNGNLVAECRYDEVRDFQEGYAAVSEDGKWGFLNEDGTVSVQCIYDEVHDFQEGYAAVTENEKWGFIDGSGTIKIELQYDAVGNYSEGKVAVKICRYNGENDKWAYIDKENQIVIDYASYYGIGGLMNYVGEFHDGLAFVTRDFYSIIDTKGNMVFDGADSYFMISSLSYNSEYDVIPAYVYADDEMKVRKYGLVGLNGEERLEPVFDFIGDINGPYVIVYETLDNEDKFDTMGVIKLK